MVSLYTWHSPWKTQPVCSFIFPGINREIKGHEVQLRWGVLGQQPSCCHSFTWGGNSLLCSTCCKAAVTGDEMVMFRLGCFCWNNSPILHYIVTGLSEKWPRVKKKYGQGDEFFLVDFAYFDYSSGIWYNRLKFSLLSWMWLTISPT